MGKYVYMYTYHWLYRVLCVSIYVAGVAAVAMWMDRHAAPTTNTVTTTASTALLEAHAGHATSTKRARRIGDQGLARRHESLRRGL